MVDVHGVDLDATSLPREALQQPLLLTAEPKPTMIGTFDEFRERLDNFSGGLLKELSEIRGIVVAGGSVVGALMQVPAGDIDIFLQVPVENARTTLAEILKAIQRNQEKQPRRGDCWSRAVRMPSLSTGWDKANYRLYRWPSLVFRLIE